MLRSLKGLHGNAILATDGEIGKVYDFYFDDQTWLIRYLVADTGKWLPSRKVLITAAALGKPNTARNWARSNIPVSLTRQQVRTSPQTNTATAVSPQKQEHSQSGLGSAEESKNGQANVDIHLRSASGVEGYRIHTLDGDLGHIADLIADDARWIIRYIVVNTSNWFPAKKVLLAPQCLRGITHLQRTVTVDLRRDDLLNCPEFHPTAGVNREYEEVLYDYYGRPTYWDETENLIKTRRGAKQQ